MITAILLTIYFSGIPWALFMIWLVDSDIKWNCPKELVNIALLAIIWPVLVGLTTIIRTQQGPAWKPKTTN
jgi:hypothetical protein